MKKTRILASVLALVMCLSAMPMSAFAIPGCTICGANPQTADDGLCDVCRNQQEATLGANKVDVSLTIDEKWAVKIPKTIALAAYTKSADYIVKVNGNIPGTKQIKVAPDASFLMSQDGKDDITATITQEKQVVTSVEIEPGAPVTLEGSISAPAATSGTWNGSFNFEIALLESFSIGDTVYQAEPDMTWEQWVNSEYNTDGWDISSSKIIQDNGGFVVTFDGMDAPGHMPNATDKIEAGRVYYSTAD